MAGETEYAAAKQLHDELLPKVPTHDTADCAFCSPNRETAAEGAGMAGETTSTIDLNDPAIQAIVKDRVATETAALSAERDHAVGERDALQTKVDVLEAEKVAAEQARDTAQQELASERDKVANEQAAASRRETRKAALAEKVPHLGDEWFAAEVAKDGERVVTRLDRIAAMDEDAFTGYVSEIAAAFEGVEVKPTTTTTTTPPRETAMAGTSTPAGAPAGSDASKASSFLGRVGYAGAIRR